MHNRNGSIAIFAELEGLSVHNISFFWTFDEIHVKGPAVHRCSLVLQKRPTAAWQCRSSTRIGLKSSFTTLGLSAGASNESAVGHAG